MTERLYLDHAATTPIVPAARTAHVDGMLKWANPSSAHAEGRAARAALEDARSRIAAALGWQHDVIFTSGATEAIAIGLGGANADATFIAATEHVAVHRAGARGYFLSVGVDGQVTADALAGRLGALGARQPLVAIQSTNNETGILQPLHQLGPIIRDAGGLLFADCSQSAAKLPLPDADMIAVSAHKLGGPPGVGALLVRNLDMLQPTGGQERGYRGGTENLPGVLGFAAAVEANRGWVERAQDLRTHLDGAIEAAGGEIVARGSPRIATIAGYRMPGVASATQLIQFDMAGIAVSAGSACSSGTIKTSPVLSAMGWDDGAANEVVRVSFGPDTTRADVYRFIEAWKRIKR
ncbi:MAG: aminotransferase class V-fold PLP-dependent enzyme [Pseudomonadota bacterium]